MMERYLSTLVKGIQSERRSRKHEMILRMLDVKESHHREHYRIRAGTLPPFLPSRGLPRGLPCRIGGITSSAP
jgi:hypothetical protein